MGPYANGKLPALHAGIEGSTPSGSTSRGLVPPPRKINGLGLGFAEKNTERVLKQKNSAAGVIANDGLFYYRVGKMPTIYVKTNDRQDGESLIFLLTNVKKSG